jgi:PAS domain S-box-containing protein
MGRLQTFLRERLTRTRLRAAPPAAVDRDASAHLAADPARVEDALDARAEALRQREASLAAAEARAELGRWELDLATQTGWWSPGMFRLMGADPARGTPALGEFLDLIHPDDRQHVETVHARVVQEGGQLTLEFRTHPARGPVRHFRATALVIDDPQGGSRRLAGTALDITERKRVEAALGESERLFETLAEVSPVGIFRTDASGSTTYVNPRWCEISGLPAAAATGDGWLRAVHPADRESLAQGWSHAAEARHVSRAEYRFLRADGTVAWVLGYAVPETSATGEILGYVGTITDITERKHAELRIQQLNRVHAVLSEINQTIVRESDPRAMLTAACRIAVDTGRFCMAWIGLADATSGRLTLAAHAGASGDTVQFLNDLLAGDLPGCVFTDQALHTGQHGICNDVACDPRSARWRDAALQRGYRAMVSLPLGAAGRVTGTFNLYASEPSFFNDQELRLLDELAMNIAFALDVGAREARRRQAEDELRWRTAFFEAQVHSAIDGILVVDHQGRKILQNERMTDMWRIPPHVAAQPDDSRQIEFVLDRLRDPERFVEKLAYLNAHPDETSVDEIDLLDGTTFDRYSAPVRGRDGQHYGRVWTFRDITGRKRAETERLRLMHDLSERVKELTALHRIARLLQADRPFNQALLAEVAAVLPPAWQYPEVCEARLTCGDLEAATAGWLDTAWTQTASSATNDARSVTVSVAYLAERPPSAEGPFLAEERQLIQSVADMLAAHLERRRVEDALRVSEERFRSAMEGSPIGTAIVSPEGRWLEVNPVLCDLVGYTREELLATDFQHITHPDDLAADLQYLRQLLAGRIDRFQSEKRYVHKDGRTVWAQLNASLARDAQHRPAHFICQIQDITGRRRSEAALLAMNARYARQEAALTTLTRSQVTRPDHLAVVLADITEVVASTLDVDRVSIWRFGPGKATIVCTELYEAAARRHSSGMELRATSHPAYFRALEALDVLAARDANEDARTAALADEYLRPLGITSILDAPIHSHGEVAGIVSCEHVGPMREWAPDEQTFAVAVANMVSALLAQVDRQQIEEQLRQTQKMESIGRLAGGVAHDFNNILAVIQMHAGLLAAEPGISPEHLDVAVEIERAAERAANLTRQLLLFSRAQALEPRDLDLNDVVTGINRMLQRILGEDIRILFKLSPRALIVHADAGMLEQVLMNLAVNARDAMPHGGRLVVETSAVELDDLAARQAPQARQGTFACLYVSDTGCGIPREVAPRIFEPFFTTKEVGRGTGLGLATVFGIVEQHKGWINVYSEVGRGTTFRVYLPCLMGDAEAVGPARQALAPARGGHETILLVEDDAALRAVVRSTLVRLGYRVVEAPSGSAALSVWDQHRDDVRLLLTDLVMPDGMSGRDLAAHLLGRDPHLRVLYTSGYSADVAGRDGTFEDGVNFLAKPFQARTLAQAVRESLDRG